MLGNALNEVVGVIVGGVATALSAVGGVVIGNRRRTKRHAEILDVQDGRSERLETIEQEVETVADSVARQERYWTGDPDDPDNPGALEDLHDIKEEIQDD